MVYILCTAGMSLIDRSKILVQLHFKEFSFAYYARRYMSNGMIHVQQSFRKSACGLNKF